MSLRRRWTGRGVAVLVAGLLAPFLVPDMAEPVATTLCGPDDLPETGLQGDVPLLDQQNGRADLGYNCGLALVGHSSLGERGGNANMTWSGDCAYIAGDGIAVVDVRDPAHPRHVRTLHGPGSDATIETLAAVDVPGRHLLAAGRYGLFGLRYTDNVGPVDLWDTTDCANPRLVSTIYFPGNVHNLTFNSDGTRLWSTLPLGAMDVTNPLAPVLLPDIEAQIAANGAPKLQYAHEAWPSPDDTRLYIGDQQDALGEQLLVVDTTNWPARPARAIGSVSWPGHSIRPATIDGKPYIVASDESIVSVTAKGCLPEALTPFGGAGRPALIDLSNEDLPRVRSQLELAINEPIHCVDQVLSGVNASVHYQDVDDPLDTTFVMASMWNAGLRIWDVRDPLHPREVAYFNPGRFAMTDNPFDGKSGIGAALALQGLNGLDQAWAHTRYRPDTGHLWLTTSTGGFWVLELEPQVRAALGLPAKPAAHPDGAPPRPPSTQAAVPARTAVGYCLVASVTSALPL